MIAVKTSVFKKVFGVLTVLSCLLSQSSFRGHCDVELSIHIFLIFGSQVTLGNLREILQPKVKKFLQSFANSNSSHSEDSFIDCEVSKPAYSVMEDYFEMVIQLGFVSLFSASFPLAPAFALLNNYLEVAVDYSSLCNDYREDYRKPQVETMGNLEHLLGILLMVSVVTNAYFFAFDKKGDLISSIAVFLSFCAFIFLLQAVINICIPNTPPDVDSTLRRHKSISHSLAHSEVTVKPSRRLSCEDIGKNYSILNQLVQ